MDPRVERSRAKIFEAVLESLADDGYSAMTIEGVAARAGVGKTTIYRHWESKAKLVIEAVHEHRITLPIPDTGSLREDLLAILGHLAERLTGEGPSRIMPAMIQAAEIDPELAELHRGFVHERRLPMMTVLQQAIDRGDLPDELDVEVAADMLAGPLFFRRFITREPVTHELVEQMIDTLLPQLGTIRVPTHRRKPHRDH